MQKKIILILLLIIIIAVILKSLDIYTIILKNAYPIKYTEYVEKYSVEYGVDKLLIYSIMKAESDFKPDAISSSGAIGLMQIMKSTADEILLKDNKQELTTKDLIKPENNIMIGTKYYSELIKKYNGNMLLSLAAYNAGIGNVDDWISNGRIKSDGSNIENIPFKETNMYVRKIINNYKIYQKLYTNL